MSKPIALQLWAVRAQMKEDFAGTMKQVAAMGYAAVETAALPVDTEEGARVFSDLGLKVCSTHAGFPNRENGERIIEEQKVLGSDTIVAGFGQDALKDEDGIKRAAETMQAAVAYAKPYGIRIGLHNHWWEFKTRIGGRPVFDLLMAQAPDAFSELDTFWTAHGGADPVHVVGRYRARLPMLHIKDGPIEAGRPHTAVGKGEMDISGLVRAADPGVLEWLIVELDECATDMMEAVRDSYSYLVSSGLGHGNK